MLRASVPGSDLFVEIKKKEGEKIAVNSFVERKRRSVSSVQLCFSRVIFFMTGQIIVFPKFLSIDCFLCEE